MTKTSGEALHRGRNPLGLKPRRGFTLIELIIALAVIGLSVSIGIPALFQQFHRVKIEGINRQVSAMLQRARFEAIKRGVRTVVAIDPDAREIFCFVDVHGVTLGDPSDGVFNPQFGPVGATDFEVSRIRLPIGVEFQFEATEGLASVEGFSNTGNPDPPDKRIIFKPIGSVIAEGAFRFGDLRGNYLEVRVSPASTARVAVRKWDGVAWRAFGDGGKPWSWQ